MHDLLDHLGLEGSVLLGVPERAAAERQHRDTDERENRDHAPAELAALVRLQIEALLLVQPRLGLHDELAQLRVVLDLLSLPVLGVDDDVLAEDLADLDLRADLAHGEGAEVELVLLDEPALVRVVDGGEGGVDVERLGHRRLSKRSKWGNTREAPSCSW